MLYWICILLIDLGGAIMEKEIKNFGYHLSIEKNLSKKTVTTYTNCLYCFTSYVTNVENFDEITIPDIKTETVKRYLIYLKDVKRNQISTISLKISALKSFYNISGPTKKDKKL